MIALDESSLDAMRAYGFDDAAYMGCLDRATSDYAQTVSPVVDWPDAFAVGLTYHPTEVEIWQTIAAGGSANLSQAQLQTFASEL